MDDRLRRLEAAKAVIRRTFGNNAIYHASERVQTRIPVIPTGSIALDAALGVGGLPRGRITEIYGPESSGKTTLALQLIAEVQRLGGIAGFVDAEHALDLRYARALGVDMDALLISQPDYGEQALAITETLVSSGSVDLVAVDSVAALVPKAELEGEMGDAHVGLQARLMSQALRRLAGAVSRTQCAVIFINQIREKVGVLFGNPEITPGGRALKFYASVRLEVRRADTLKEGQETVGVRARIRVVKNKLAPPFREAMVDILYGQGISREGSLLDVGTELDPPVITKSGSWYSFGSQRLGQGREQARAYLRENPAVRDAIERAIRERLNLLPPQPEPSPQPAADGAGEGGRSRTRSGGSVEPA